MGSRAECNSGHNLQRMKGINEAEAHAANDGIMVSSSHLWAAWVVTAQVSLAGSRPLLAPRLLASFRFWLRLALRAICRCVDIGSCSPVGQLSLTSLGDTE